MADKKGGGKDGKDKKKRRKYLAPTLGLAGSLLTISKSALFAAQSLCCLSERLRLARRSAAERRRLLSDVGRLMAGA